MKPALHIQGMHGLGDNLHQRAVVRQLMQTRNVTLETSWPSVYHDLIADGLAVTRRPVGLRTQAKNAAREAHLYSPRHAFTRPGMRISYTGQQVLQTPSKTVLEVMCNVTGTSYEHADYRLPIPDAWRAMLPEIPSHKPLMVYRPLVARPEWRGSMARNADPASYDHLYRSVRDKFFVVSVADLGNGIETIVGPDAEPDLSFHQGELVFEALAALYEQAHLVFTSSGFSAILGPAVGTPTFSVGGGYEDYRCHDSGKKFAPYVAIGPRVGCTCWTSACRKTCTKSIDLIDAKDKLNNFLSDICIQNRDTSCPDM